MPGPSAVQAQAARDQTGRGALLASVPQAKADDGLFARPEAEQPELEPARQPEPARAPAVAEIEGLPPGARLIEGKGPLGRGKWGIELDGKLVWNLEGTQEKAIAEAKAALSRRASAAARSADKARHEQEIATRLRRGETLADSDLKRLNLKPSSSGFEWLSPVVQRLFGISKAKVREAMGDSLRQATSDMGAEMLQVGNPRKALANAARYAEERGIHPSGGELFQRFWPWGFAALMALPEGLFAKPGAAARTLGTTSFAIRPGAPPPEKVPIAELSGDEIFRQGPEGACKPSASGRAETCGTGR